LKPAQKFIVRIAFHWDIPNQFPDKVLSVKSTFASALVDPDFSNIVFHFIARDNLPRSAVFRSRELQNADVVQDDDISTLLPSLVRYDRPDSSVGTRMQNKLRRISIDALQAKTGLSRNTILRARRGQKVRARSVKVMRDAVVAFGSAKPRDKESGSF
jgi:hypothetical protein